MKRQQKSLKSFSTKRDKLDESVALGIHPIPIKYQKFCVSPKNQVDITQKVLTYLMGSSVTLDKKEEAIEYLFQRDHSKFLKLLKGDLKLGQFGTYLMPPIFFSQMPDVLDSQDYERKLADAMAQAFNLKYEVSDSARKLNMKWKISEKGNVVPRDYVADGTFGGDIAERKLFTSLKDYFDGNGDDCLILHSHVFLHGENYKEKDFIVLNLTKGYVMVIEGKASARNFGKAIEQLLDSKKRIQAVFNSIKNISGDWKFIGLCYIEECNEDYLKTHQFVIVGGDDFCSKLSQVEGQLFPSIWNSEIHINDFVEISKHLLYRAQGHKEAPISGASMVKKVSEHLDKASIPENIFFWTPDQMSIVQAMHIDWMCLIGWYGVGKTIILIERAEQLSKDTNNMVHFYVDKQMRVRESPLPLKNVLEKRFEHKNNIKVKSINMSDLENQIIKPQTKNIFEFENDTKMNNHVIIDEVLIGPIDYFKQLLLRMKLETSTLWIAIGGGLNVPVIQFKRELEQIGMTCPKLEHCLRNGYDIAHFCKNSNGSLLGELQSDFEIRNTQVINTGMFIDIDCKPDTRVDEIGALRIALQKVPNYKCLIFIGHNYNGGPPPICLPDVEKAFPTLSFTDFNDEKATMEWYISASAEGYLFCNDTRRFEISGLEFDNMIYIVPKCNICQKEESAALVVSRAKSSLIVSRFTQNCADGTINKKCDRYRNMTVIWAKPGEQYYRVTH